MTHGRWLARQAAIWGLGAAALRLLVVPAERCPPADPVAVRSAVTAAADWLVRGQGTDGRFLYGYDRRTRRTSGDYNETRHAGVVYALYRAGRTAAADGGLRHIRDSVVRHGDWSVFAPAGQDADSGANALTVAALAQRRLSGGDARHDDLARRLGRFLVAQTEPRGSVLRSWRPATGRPVPGRYGTFETGETFYALTLLHRLFPREGWDGPARRIAAYLAEHRDAAEGYATRQPDHWAAYGLAELAPSGLTAVEVAYTRRLAGYFGYEIRYESARTERPLNLFTESGADLGVVGEGAAALWRAAGPDARLADLRGELAERIDCLTGITVARQVSPAAADPRTRGAWFHDGSTQMDDQQHAIGALLGAAEVLR